MLSLLILFACRSSSAPLQRLTYTEDVKPIIEKYCTSCHQPGGSGGTDFNRSSVVIPMAEIILQAIDNGSMPPSASDPQCHEYIGSDRIEIPSSERNIIAQWITSGKELGAPILGSPSSNYSFERPDLEVLPSESYTPTYSNIEDLDNEYRCFAIEHNRTEAFYITGFQALVDNRDTLKKIVLAKAPRDTLTLAPGEHVDCMNDTQEIFLDESDILDHVVSIWTPHVRPLHFEYAGIYVEPDEVFILQMHYHQTELESTGTSDRSGFALFTEEYVAQKLQMKVYGSKNFLITADNEASTFSASTQIPAMKIWSVFPYMRLLGSEYHLSVEANNESKCIIDTQEYDPLHRRLYQFDDPIAFQSPSTLSWSCTWNNSYSNENLYHTPPVDVYYGNRSDQESCYAFVLLSEMP